MTQLRKFNPTIGKYEMLKATLPTLKVWKLIANTWRIVFDAPNADLCSCNRNRRVKDLEMAFALMKDQFEPEQESIEDEPKDEPIEDEPKVDEGQEQEPDKESDELVEIAVDKKGKVKGVKGVKNK